MKNNELTPEELEALKRLFISELGNQQFRRDNEPDYCPEKIAIEEIQKIINKEISFQQKITEIKSIIKSWDEIIFHEANPMNN